MKNPQLPNELLQAIEAQLSKVPRHTLAVASKELTANYRNQDEHKKGPLITTEAHRLAYLAVRMPATFAAVTAVLDALMQQMPNFSPRSLCDIGAGPGTAAFACIQAFSTLEHLCLYEMDPQLITIGKQLFKASSPQFSPSWTCVNVAQPFTPVSSDLSILSYAIGELNPEAAHTLIESVWRKTHILVLIEPGTPRGFSYIRKAREQLTANGGFLVAPCPHQHPCPMQPPDWCHFATRLPRTEMHLLVKEVDRGYEDEKFSYIVASKIPVALPYARVLRNPEHHSGHTRVVLCTTDGLKSETFSRKQGACYKQIKKVLWGSKLETTLP